MNICICDAEIRSCVALESHVMNYLHKNHMDAKVSIYNSIRELVTAQTQFDIIFMGIDFDDGNGLEEIIRNPRYRESIVIFVTLHGEEVFNGYKANAFRFLLKPIQQDALVEALDSALSHLKENRILVFQSDRSEICIKLKDIVYLETNEKMVGIRTKKDFYSARGTISEFMRRLNFKNFYSPHRSYIINMDYVKAFDRKQIVMDNDEKISISRLKKETFREVFYDYIQNKN